MLKNPLFSRLKKKSKARIIPYRGTSGGLRDLSQGEEGRKEPSCVTTDRLELSYIYISGRNNASNGAARGAHPIESEVI